MFDLQSVFRYFRLCGLITLLSCLALFNLRCDALFDIEPPKIEIIEPQEGISYSGTVPVELQVTDNRKVKKVEVFLDDISVHEFTREPYNTEIDLGDISAGTFKVVAYDRAGNWADTEQEALIVTSAGLVAHYPFSGNANDESANGNDGTVNGATLTTDRFGNANSAYSFNGVSNTIGLPIKGTDFGDLITISIWAYRTKSFSGSGTNPMMGIINSSSATDKGISIALNHESRISFTVWNASGTIGSVYLSSPTMNLSEWNHFVLSYDGSFVKGYLDNQELGSTALSGSVGGTLDFRIGQDQYDDSQGRFWGGMIDDIRIYDRALNATEIEALYNEGSVDSTAAASWSVVSSPSSESLNGVWGNSSTDIYISGNNGIILHNDGSSWSSIVPPSTPPALYDIWGSSSSDVFIGGYSGTIFHYDGSSWSVMPNTTSMQFPGVWGTSSSDVWAVGGTGSSTSAIIHYDGSTWSSVSSSSASCHLYAVWGSSPTDVWAVGNCGVIVHFNGSVWSSVTSPTSNLLEGIWGTSSSNIWAVGGSGLIIHYDGSSWSSASSPTLETITGIWGNSPTDIWAVGLNGTIIHYDGISWGTTASPTTNTLIGIWGSSSYDIWATGENGTILHYAEQ